MGKRSAWASLTDASDGRVKTTNGVQQVQGGAALKTLRLLNASV